MLASILGRSDKAIVRRVLRGQRDDFGELVERYYGAVRAVVDSRVPIQADAEDIAQDAFVRAFTRLDTLQDPARFGPWLTSIARNTALNWAIRKKESVTLDTLPEAAAGSEEPAMERREREQLVRDHLDRLDEGPREIIYLHYFSGKSLREIAELTNISREAAAKRLQRARESLGEELLRVLSDDAKPAAKDHSHHYKVIMAAIAGTSVAWRASAGAASGGLLAGAGAKVGVGVVIVVLALGGGWAGLQLRAETDPTVEAPLLAEAAPEPVVAVSPEELPPTEEVSPMDEDGLPTGGPGKITVQCVTINDEPFEGAEVSVELVDWEAHEFPPEETFIRHAVSDAYGRAVFENLPIGTYHNLALAEGRVGVNDSFIRETRLEDKSRRVLMLPAKSLRGRVVTPEGDPVAGAVIYPVIHKMFPDREISHTEMAGLRRITNEGGIFRYKNMMKGDVRFFVLAPNGQQMFSDYVSIPSLNAEIVLGRSGGVQFAAVHAASGQPISGLKIQIRRGSRLVYTATTDVDGNCGWPDVAPGVYQLAIDDPVLVPDARSRTVEVPETGTLHEQRLQFLQGGTVVGRVAVVGSGEGVPGAKIYCYDEPTQHKLEHTEVVSGPDGSFVITGLAEGTVNLTHNGEVDGYVFGGNDVSVNVRPGEESTGVTLRAMKSALVAGKVFGPEGRTMTGATVTANAYYHGEDGQDFYGRQEVVSSLDGRFTLTQLPGGTDLNISAAKGDQRSATVRMPLPEDGARDIELTLSAPLTGVIEGYALTASRTPISRGSVNAYLLGSGSPTSATIRRGGLVDHPYGDEPRRSFSAHADTDAIGYFKLEGLPPGEYRLTPQHFYTDRQIHCEGSTVRLGDGQYLKDVEVFCHPPGDLRITGRVLRPDGRPVMYALVQQMPNGNRHATENEGYFVLDGLTPGVHTIQFATHEYSPVVMEVEAGAQNVIVQLQEHASLRGQVVDADTGLPIPQYVIRYTQPGIASEDAREPPIGELSVDDEQGSFRFTNLAADAITLRVTAEGYQQPEPNAEHLIGGVENEALIYLEPIREEELQHDELSERVLAPAGQVLQREDGTLVLAPDEGIEE